VDLVDLYTPIKDSKDEFGEGMQEEGKVRHISLL